jgi:oxygen-dependent protoporphyrinogen oxidase
LMGGIYAGDGEQLSLAATFPQLRRAELDYGGLIKGVVAARAATLADRPDGKPWPAFVTPATGVAEIVEALTRRLGDMDVRLRARAVRVQAAALAQAARPGYLVLLEGGEWLTAQAVILATPAFVTSELIAGLDSRAAAALRDIPYVSTATVSVAYPLADIPRPLDGYGYIIPRAEQRPILACTWTSTKFPRRAPPGFGLIRAFIGRAGQEGAPAGSDDELLSLVRAELRRTLGISAAPALRRIFRWPQAMPQYTLGHLERLAIIEQRLAALPGLFVAGSAYRGVGLPDCIQSGEHAAEAALKFVLQ